MLPGLSEAPKYSCLKPEVFIVRPLRQFVMKYFDHTQGMSQNDFQVLLIVKSKYFVEKPRLV